MALKFLFNAAGIAADAIGNTGSGSTATGYDTTAIMCGQRSTAWRSTSATANSIGYTYDDDVTISHVVVARADWLVTKAGQRVRGRQRNSGGTWSDIAAFDKNPLAASDLIGPRTQDLVVACAPTDLRGLGLSFTPATGSEASQLSKLYGANAFSFTEAVPSFGVNWTTFEPNTLEKSMRGTFLYDVERGFSLSFFGLSETELTSFMSTTNLYHWPFFIYDEDQEIWEWKLEHVILAGLEARMLMPSFRTYELELRLLRLRHYD